MLRPLPAYPVYCLYCLAERAVRTTYWTAAVSFYLRQLVPPIVNAWINRHIPSAVRATVLSVMSQADAAGQIAGGPIFGAIASARSTGVAMIAAGLAVLPGIPLLVRALQEHPRLATADKVAR